MPALSYKEECVPITSTRSEVAGDIVHAMQVQLTPKEQARLARSQRTNSGYDLYCARWCTWLEIARTIRPPSSCGSRPSLAIQVRTRLCGLGREYRTKALSSTKGKTVGGESACRVENALSFGF